VILDGTALATEAGAVLFCEVICGHGLRMEAMPGAEMKPTVRQ
jgi:hypothetical protein